uniref:Arginine decarboxylase n=1 Tax=Leersia perrieri TaxID=77586 RepID=A0A0D9WLE4_9ORYZ
MPALAVDAASPVAAHAFAACDAARFPAPLLGPTFATAAAAVEDNKPDTWSADLSSALYNVDGWGAPYFFVNDDGDVAVRPHGAATLPGQEIDLAKVVAKAAGPRAGGGLGLPLPLLVRFPDVLRHRVEALNAAFDYAVRSTGYGGRYQGVYPVKCNQDRHVVEDIVEFGEPFRFGLEAGSKPELLLAMSCLAARGNPDALLICNGYKDDEYVSLALMARTMGLNTVIVLEQEEELDIVVDASRRLGVRPVVGMRAKLRTKHAGHFGSTSGEKGKFGLNAAQILSVVSKLKTVGMLDCLQLLHFHIGSQIPTTSLLADGVGEAAQIYCELARLGAAMRVIDVGGGLGIDYDGSHSAQTDMSVAYSLEEYAAAVVAAVGRVCDRRGVAHPIICSESGRALVSHHSVLVFEAFSASSPGHIDPATGYLLDELTDDCHADYRNLMAAAVRGDFDTCGLYADQLKRRCAEQFKEGILGLEHLAAVDSLCEIVARGMGAGEAARTYHINLSVFTSLPDMWAIGQMFPIIPIQRLGERPAVDGVLSDLTCDSDGKVEHFIGGRQSLPLHEIPVHGTRGYYLGMFLGGAYQEALGGLHNLFGGPSVVRVSQSDGPHCFAVTRATAGPSCADVLRSMQHEPEVMFEVLKQRTDAATAAAIARAFGAMPYLSFDPEAAAMSSDSDEGSAAGVAEEDDDEWEFMRGLTV